MFKHLAALLGRILLSVIFVLSGAHKFTAWTDTAQLMEAEGIQYVNVLLPIAAVVEVVGGLMLLFGCCTRPGTLALIVFLIPTTLIFHDFWTYEGIQQQMQMINFMKNLAIMGGLFVVLGFGPGAWSVDGARQLWKAAGSV